MIVIKSGVTNRVKLSIADKRTFASGTTVYFFMEVINDMTQQNKGFYITLSETTARYLMFSIIEPDTHNFVEQGFFTYRIWETTNAALNQGNYVALQSAVTPISRGKLYFDDTANTEVSYTQYTPTDNTNTTNSNTVYLTI